MASSKRDQLVDTALKLFYRDGFHARGIDRILAEPGVAKVTLYKHFRSKDELILATLLPPSQHTDLYNRLKWGDSLARRAVSAQPDLIGSTKLRRSPWPRSTTRSSSARVNPDPP